MLCSSIPSLVSYAMAAALQRGKLWPGNMAPQKRCYMLLRKGASDGRAASPCHRQCRKRANAGREVAHRCRRAEQSTGQREGGNLPNPSLPSYAATTPAPPSGTAQRPLHLAIALTRSSRPGRSDRVLEHLLVSASAPP